MQQLQVYPNLPFALEFHAEPFTAMANLASPMLTFVSLPTPMLSGVKLDSPEPFTGYIK